MKENKETTKFTSQENDGTSRRGFITKTIFAGASLAAGSLALAASQNQASAQTGKRNNQRANNRNAATSSSIGRRRLGKLEVSSIGMGVQNMHRTFQTTVPYRPEMIEILRAAYDRGITFFDCAEAYGPHENERILGEAIQSFRNKVVITSKFGWNIDLVSRQRTQTPPAAIVRSETKVYTNSIGMEFISFPAGSFMMGASDSAHDAYQSEKPQHKVNLSKPFSIGKYEVTKAQWEALMSSNPYTLDRSHSRP